MYEELAAQKFDCEGQKFDCEAWRKQLNAYKPNDPLSLAERQRHASLYWRIVPDDAPSKRLSVRPALFPRRMLKV